MSIEKSQDQYIGDVVGGLIREASMLRTKCAYLEAEIHRKNAEIEAIRQADPGADHYIDKEPHA